MANHWTGTDHVSRANTQVSSHRVLVAIRCCLIIHLTKWRWFRKLSLNSAIPVLNKSTVLLSKAEVWSSKLNLFQWGQWIELPTYLRKTWCSLLLETVALGIKKTGVLVSVLLGTVTLVKKNKLNLFEFNLFGQYSPAVR